MASSPDIRGKLSQKKYDAVVVGSGPNGLAAAIVMLERGYSVAVIEGQSTAGGGCRSAELTLPGYVHDLCSSVHPLGFGSPIFRTWPLDKFGLEWVQPPAPYAHPFDGGRAAVVERSIEATAAQFGPDARGYKRLMQPIVPGDWDEVCQVLREPIRLAKYPIELARFGMRAIQPVQSLAHAYFNGVAAGATIAGVAAHSSLRMNDIASASFGVVLGLAAHAVGWPFPRGGSQKLIDALIGYLRSLGGEIILSSPVGSLEDLPEWDFLFLDLTPRQVLKIAGEHLTSSYRKQLQGYVYGPASFKVDWALSAPVPWEADGCKRAGTVHIGGTLEEIAESEAGNWNGEHSRKPYVLFAQTSLFDPTRAPEGKHTAWGYCHVPNGSTFDMTERIEDQIERFAPGFKSLILARHVTNPVDMQKKNANYIGGDINGGALSFNQLFTRPVARPIPYKTGIRNMFLCSSATPPGGGVHGMCGYYAAHAALMGERR
ncbi:MAG TPA: NAD(P)/FAD-dependent oxidoreductase [Planktothrix sp.]|jgi:phytoene dehydrogenase-like protein